MAGVLQMSDELPAVTQEFLTSELSRTIPKLMKKNGGPYTKGDRVKRRNEVFRLHFSLGYSAVKIAQLMNVNRHTIESDIKYGYSILAKEWNRSTIDSWFMKQVYRLEEQRTRLLEKLNGLTGREYLTTEQLLKEIDVRIFYMIKDVMTSIETNAQMIIKKINGELEKYSIQERLITPFDYTRASTKTRDKIIEMIKNDHQENT